MFFLFYAVSNDERLRLGAGCHCAADGSCILGRHIFRNELELADFRSGNCRRSQGAEAYLVGRVEGKIQSMIPIDYSLEPSSNKFL